MKVYLHALALHFDTQSGATMQPPNESWHHYGDVQRMPRMDCGMTPTNSGVAEKQQKYYGEAQSGSMSGLKTVLGRRP